MFSCRKCKSDLKDTDRYCYGCGAYIGEPAVMSDEWQELENNEGEQIDYEYNEEGKIIKLHCEECDAIVEKCHKYCNNCGKSLENNIRVELVEIKTLDESSVDIEGEESGSTLSGFVEKNEKRLVYFIKKFFSNKKVVIAASLVLIFAAGGYSYKQLNKPVPRYEQDTSYNTFVKDKDWMYYSYYRDTKIKGLQEKRGIYKIKADGPSSTKLSDNPAACMNIYKDYIYYLNVDDRKIYRMKKDGSDNKKVSDEAVESLLVDRGYIYYRDKAIGEVGSNLFRMKLDGTKNTKLSTDVLTYNIVGDYIYYSSCASLGDVYRIKTDGSGMTKMCKIDGPIKYIKDGYIYYSMVSKSLKDPFQYVHTSGYIGKVKLDGTNPTKLSNKEVTKFFIDNKNNIFYLGTDVEKNEVGYYLYKSDFSGKGDTKAVEKISPVFYVDNNQVYYMDNNTSLLYRADFKGSNKISLLGIDEKLAETYNISTISMGKIPAKEIEDFNKAIKNNRVVILNKKGDNKAFEGYNLKVLDSFVRRSELRDWDDVQFERYVKDGANTNLDEYIQIQDDGKKVIYVSYKKDKEFYKVDKIILGENVIKKEQDNTIKYYLIEKKGDPEEKWMEILSINKDRVKS